MAETLPHLLAADGSNELETRPVNTGDSDGGENDAVTAVESDASGFGLHVKNVARKVREATWQRDEVVQWVKLNNDSEDIENHITNVFDSSAPRSFFQSRIRQLESAMAFQHQVLEERKKKKRDKLHNASAKAVAHAATNKPRESIDNGSPDGGTMSKIQPGGVEDATASASATRDWSIVERFKEHEEALRFVLKCQPFDYVPVKDGNDFGFQFDSNTDPLVQALNMEPLPSEFVSIRGEFKRRLRIRYVQVDEDLGGGYAKAALRKLGQRRSKMGAQKRPSGAAHSGGVEGSSSKEWKAYVVEAAGGWFEHPESLRALRETGGRYYIALNPDVANRVLVEGFRVSKRMSIPCSATPQDAIDKFKQSETHLGRQPSAYPSVLPVNVPSHIDVVAHKDGGFLIRARELPPNCFKVAPTRRM